MNVGCSIEEETKKEMDEIIENHKYIKTTSQFLQIAIKQLIKKEKKKDWK